jgi:hypothetical protein
MQSCPTKTRRPAPRPAVCPLRVAQARAAAEVARKRIAALSPSELRAEAAAILAEVEPEDSYSAAAMAESRARCEARNAAAADPLDIDTPLVDLLLERGLITRPAGWGERAVIDGNGRTLMVGTYEQTAAWLRAGARS